MTELTIQKTLKEFQGTKIDYALPNSDVDIGNMYFYACRFEDALKATMKREANLLECLHLITGEETSLGMRNRAELAIRENASE